MNNNNNKKNEMKDNSILVLGKNGMLGHMVFDVFDFYNNNNNNIKKYKILGATEKDLNIYNNQKNELEENKIEKFIIKHKPKYIINCIGIINKYANKNIILTQKINTNFPHYLNYLSYKYDFKLIHISTDCVVDNDIYGTSKLYGEIYDNKNITIRTSIIGPELKKNGKGLFHWFVISSKKNNNIDGYSNIFWDGVTTLQLSDFIWDIIYNEQNVFGLINYRTKNYLSKFNILKIINKQFDLRCNINSIKIKKNEIKSKIMIDSENKCDISYQNQILNLYNYMLIFKNTKYSQYFVKKNGRRKYDSKM
jgi:dTDP-4-dehydrorhamnose reductase